MEKSNKNNLDSQIQNIKKYALVEQNLFFCSSLHTQASNDLLQPIILCVEMPGRDAGGNPSQRRSPKMKSTGIIIGA